MSCLLTYTNSITGDCLNDLSGAFSVDITGSAPDYSIEWISPFVGTISLGPGITNYTQTGLSGGTYSFNIIDSCSPTNTTLAVNVNISTGTCVSITSETNTACGLDNGALTATTTNMYSEAKFYLYEYSSGYITSGTSFTESYSFNTLSAGTYYVIADDGGGCTGKSETCIIKESTPLEIGLYVVNDAGCAVNSGGIYITGLTGVPPYTYLWSNGETTQSITGLTAGPYNVTVTDGSGCSQSSGVTITKVPPVGLGAFTVVSPSCFASDGEVTITITGGTAPFYYSGSNGTVAVSFATSYTFVGVPAGMFSVHVTDAGLCSFTSSTTLLTPGGLTVTSVNITNSVCNDSSGKIKVIVYGGSPPYTYTLTDSIGNSTVITGSFTSWTFNSLPSDTYTLTISDSGPCVFTHEYVVDNTVLFELTVETVGTTCNLNDGQATLNITTGGVGPFQYEIDGQTTYSNDYTYTFIDLVSGSYTATVTDTNGCAQIVPFNIGSSSSVDFVLVGTDSTDGTNGSITAFITSGEPTFTWEWSSNVNGQTDLTVSNLSAGTYSLTVTDINGCTLIREIVINGFNELSSYQIFNICDDDFMNTGQTIRKGPQQMLNEGFYDLTSGDTNCILNQAIFTAQVTVSGVTQFTDFYTGYTLNDYPSDSLFYDTVNDSLLSYEGIGDVVIDYVNNIITISTDCDSSVSLTDADVKIELKISYDINCQTCDSSFISIWRTTTPFESITLPYDPSGTYGGVIDWGDGNSDANDYGNITHIYTTPGDYYITISGIIDGFSFYYDDTNNVNLIEIKQWGNLKISDTSSQFRGCSNMNLDGVLDIPDLSLLTTMERMFLDCTSLTNINNVDLWDVSNIIYMQATFANTNFNGDIRPWVVSGVTKMTAMFNNIPSFDVDISLWDVSSVNNMDGMFANSTSFNRDLSGWCVTLIPALPFSFDDNTTSWSSPRPDWGNCPI
jgi:surface protein